jgi:hypothetical protein
MKPPLHLPLVRFARERDFVPLEKGANAETPGMGILLTPRNWKPRGRESAGTMNQLMEGRTMKMPKATPMRLEGQKYLCGRESQRASGVTGQGCGGGKTGCGRAKSAGDLRGRPPGRRAGRSG